MNSEIMCMVFIAKNNVLITYPELHSVFDSNAPAGVHAIVWLQQY